MNSMSLKVIQYLKKNPWYEGTFELFEYGNFPAECPWQKTQELDRSIFIQRIFQPITTLIPNTYKLIIENCEEIYALTEKDKWFLVYAINEDKFLCGGEPNKSPALPANAIADGWELPVELKTFYAIHNGFGVLWSLGIFWSSQGILPDNRLETLNPLFTSLREHEPDIVLDFDPKSLLQFFYNGLGDAQCFCKTENGELTTVDWDHESREIYHPESFWSFIDEKLSKLI